MYCLVYIPFKVLYTCVCSYFIEDAPTLGEYFDPADDCSEITRKKTNAINGFYWIKPFGFQNPSKVP